MDKTSTKTNAYFRFLSLNKLQAFTLAREVIGASYETQGVENRFVGLVPLTGMSLDDINDFYVRQRIELEQCDILVSAQTNVENLEHEAPEIVNLMLRYIDCKLRFSVTKA